MSKDNLIPAPRGELHPYAKLTASAVTAIRVSHRNGTMTQKELAFAYGVMPRTISDIINHVTWRHVP